MLQSDSLTLAADGLRLPARAAYAPADTAAAADSLPRFLLRPNEVAAPRQWDGLRPLNVDSLPGLTAPATPQDTVTLPLLRLDSLTATSTPGFTGDPLPYALRADSLVCAALALSFFVAAWIISASRHYLHECLKDFFHRPARAEAYDESTGSERRGQWLLAALTGFLLSILYFSYQYAGGRTLPDNASPHAILGAGTGICFLYYLAKSALYGFVNATLFSRQQARLWNETYLLSILATGTALLPLTLLVTFSELSRETLAAGFACLVIAVKIPLLYKCFRIFFKGALGSVHLILYFCALELAPALVLWRVLLRATLYLTLNP